MLQGFLDVFVEDESGKRITTRLGFVEVHLVSGGRDPWLSERQSWAVYF